MHQLNTDEGVIPETSVFTVFQALQKHYLLVNVNEMQLTNGDQLNEKLTIRTNGTNR